MTYFAPLCSYAKSLFARSLSLRSGNRSSWKLTLAALLALATVPATAQAVYGFSGTTAVGSSAAVAVVPVTFTNSGTIATVQVLTGGITGLDYTNAGTGSCAVNASYLTGQSCTVAVHFTPTAPGERRGAIVLLDNHGAPLAIQPLDAIAQGSLGVLIPGIINTVAGSGSWLYQGDGMVATSSQIFLPLGVAVDAAGNIFIADSGNNRIRRVDAVSGLISTVAGNGNPGFSGDNGLAISATLNNPSALALDGAGNLYIADSSNNAVRMVSASTGIITTVAGIGGRQGRTGDGAAATLALLNTPNGLAFDTTGSFYIADTGNNIIRKVSANGTITTYAGTGVYGYTGDGQNATAATLDTPWGLAVSITGNLYIADLYNQAVRKVDTSGIITTFAGTGAYGSTGDGSSATIAQLNDPAALAIDAGGNIYIADAGNNRVRKVNAASGIITTIAGTGSQAFSGDSGPSDMANIYGPYALALDGAANLYIADMFHNRIRKISSTQAILTYPAMRVDRVSDPQPQTLENDGNAPMNFTNMQAGSQSTLDPATTTCQIGTPLAQANACILGAEFAPTQTGHSVTGTLAIASDAANTPAVVSLTGEVDTLEPTTITLATSGNPVALGSSVTFTAGVSSNGAAPTGSIKFMDGTTVLGTVVMSSSSSASFTTSSLAIGPHTITAVYSGDASSSSSTSTAITENIKQTTTSTIVTSNDNVIAGASVTFTATITGASVTPTGSIIFQDGTTAIGNGTLNASGVVTFTTTSLAAGLHNITAAYQGDGNSLSSTSSSVQEAIQAVTTTTLSTSATPSSAGASVTFTATVSASGSTTSAGSLTGSVTFSDGSATLGTVAVNTSGVATFSTATLALGAHTITAAFAGTTYYAASTSAALTQAVQQATTSTLLASSANPSIVNASVTFTATVSGNGAAPTGAVIFKDGTTQIGQGSLSAGKSTFTLSTLTVGSHAITASYSGDTSNLASTSTAMTQLVQKAASATALVSTPNPSSQNVSVEFTATVTSNGTAPTGTVIFEEGSATLGTGVLNASGIATWITSALTMGQHSIVAVYQGDAANNTSSSASLQQNVLPASAVALVSSQNPGVAGAPLTFTATVSGQGAVPTGTITFRDGSITLGVGALNSQAIATLTLSTLSVGAHSIVASYAGDTANASSTSLALVQNIVQATSQTTLTASASTITRGAAITLTATVSGNGSTPAGNVTFLDNAQPLGTASLNTAGVASLTSSALSVGTHALTAAYAGDANDVASNSGSVGATVQPATPSLQIASSSNPSLTGTGVTFTATLRSATTTPSGSITWSDGSTVIGTSTVGASGVSTFTANTLTVAQHLITAAYSGDVNDVAVTSGVLTQVVQQATTTVVQSGANQSVAGANIHFVATVTGNSGNAVTGSVTFRDAGVALGTGNVTNGTAVFDTTTLITGQHNITAIYSGDTASQTSTSVIWTQSVIVATTSVTLTSSANPSVIGSGITLTAHVTGNGQAATGTITFQDGAASLGTANLNGGTAIFTTAALLAGQHILTAQYAGDANNDAATSAALTQTVQQPTTVALASGINPALTAQAVTLSATVSNGAAAPATGTVVFSDGATIIGSSPLAGGVATLQVASFTAGQHVITANYTGDTLNLASVSASVQETVQLRPSVTSLAASASTLSSGQQLTLFAAVQGSSSIAPSGTITFFSGTAQIGSATLSTAGIATFTYTPAAGTYNITASYGGDAVYAASVSSPTGAIAVNGGTLFTLTLNPTSFTVASKQFSIVDITLKSVPGYTDTMQLGCLGLPSGATCTFSNDQVNLASDSTQTVKLTFDTGSPLTAGGEARLKQAAPSLTFTCGLPLGVLFGLLLWTARRNRRYLGGIVVLALTVLTIGLSGCGAMQINGVAPGTYNVSITAAGAKTGIVQTVGMTVTVK